MYRLLTFFFLLIIPFHLSAQGIRFSFMASPQFAWLNSQTKVIQNDGMKVGMHLGLQVDRFFAPHYAFASGVFLQTIGGKLLYDEERTIRFADGNETIPAGQSMRYHLNYLTIPVGLKLTTREIGYSTFFVHLGLNGNLKLKATADLSHLGYRREAIPDEINLIYLSWFVGGGVKYSIGGNTALTGGLAYQGGINNVLTAGGLNATVNSVILQVGVLF